MFQLSFTQFKIIDGRSRFFRADNKWAKQKRYIQPISNTTLTNSNIVKRVHTASIHLFIRFRLLYGNLGIRAQTWLIDEEIQKKPGADK